MSSLAETPYRIVAVEPNVGETPIRVWWNGTDKVTEVLGLENKPFTTICFDFDDTVVLSEGPGRFFDASWARLFEEAGIAGSVEEISALRRQVYQWRNDVTTSTADLLERIERGIDLRGNALSLNDLARLRMLMDPATLSRWTALTQEYNQDRQPHSAEVIANRKEDLGAALIRDNPQSVEQLASLNPDFLEFMRALPPDLILAVGSSSRSETIIKPILGAHEQIHPEYGISQRFGDLVFGEEDLPDPKPRYRFFESLAINTAY